MNEPLLKSGLNYAAKAIRDLYPTLGYDHRPFLMEQEAAMDMKLSEEFRCSYSCFKYAVAKILQPKSICEIGVCTGIAAQAFCTASPGAFYVGIDNLYDDKNAGYPYNQKVQQRFQELGLNARFDIVSSSLDMKELPSPHQYDLVHIDGDHSVEGAYHDTKMALNSNSHWILIDDARYAPIMKGVTSAIYDHVGYAPIEWAYFEDSWTGSILISREVPR
jgi:predicted O-methyltransferase YrrM